MTSARASRLPSPGNEPPAPLWAQVGLAAGLLTVAVVAAYANSLAVPFIFDDLPSIVENPSIRQLSALGQVLAPDQAGGITTSGRPVVNLSLALNHALSGQRVWSYHVFNIVIHLLAGLCLLGLVRRTLSLPALRARFGEAALPLATVISALWLLHPLQTESVTYVIQRAEALGGLFYLLTLYGALRASDREISAAPHSRVWSAIAVSACFLGVASKEVVVSAPLLVWLFDRCFRYGTFAAAWRARRGFYLALAASWLLLAALVIATGSRGGTAGFGAGVSAWSYALTQCRALVHYVALSAWPYPLVFDHGLALERSLIAVLPQALAVLAGLAGTVWLLRRAPALGFLATLGFALLAPSSSFVPIATQTIAEHRMYLPLATLVAAGVLLAYARLGRVALTLAAVIAVGFAALTSARNRDYRSDAAIWADTAAKLPTNARAHNNLGQAQFRAGDIPGAGASYRRALALQPNYPETLFNLGIVHAAQGDAAAAVASYEQALRVQPDYPEALTNLGNALRVLGRADEAMQRYQEAVRRRPDFPEGRNNLGNALLEAGRPREAMPHLEHALRLEPDFAEAHYHLGNAHAANQDMPRALESYRTALRLQPDYAEAHVNAGNALLALNRTQDALTHYEAAVRAKPKLADAHFNFASALMGLERWTEAIPRLEETLRLRPGFPPAQHALGYALAQTGRAREALPYYETYLRAEPRDAEARAQYSEIQRALGRR